MALQFGGGHDDSKCVSAELLTDDCHLTALVVAQPTIGELGDKPYEEITSGNRVEHLQL
jgi:hypothetical protein